MLADQESALQAIESAEEFVSRERDEATVLGLEGLDPDAEIAAARGAFEADDPAGARLHGAFAVAMIEDAAVRGRSQIDAASTQRGVFAGLGALFGVWFAGVLLLRWRRKRRPGFALEAAELFADAPVFGPPTPVFGPPTPVFGPPTPVFGPPTPVATSVGASLDPVAPGIPEAPSLD
jgi:hypothetical protein